MLSGSFMPVFDKVAMDMFTKDLNHKSAGEGGGICPKDGHLSFP